MKLRDWITDLFTDANGDADETIVYALLGILTFNCLAIYNVVVRHIAFDMQAYGVGFGAILAAVFAGYGIKSKLERKPPA
jgi:hypothetical protein